MVILRQVILGVMKENRGKLFFSKQARKDKMKAEVRPFCFSFFCIVPIQLMDAYLNKYDDAVFAKLLHVRTIKGNLNSKISNQCCLQSA